MRWWRVGVCSSESAGLSILGGSLQGSSDSKNSPPSWQQATAHRDREGGVSTCETEREACQHVRQRGRRVNM